MNKRLLKWILIGAFATLLMGAAVSCKDYTSDIENLQSQITALSGDVDYLQSLINQGKVVTSVTQTSDGTGVTITFSDGNSYTIYNGKDGADGNDGKDADVWTIGDDDYWYLNGEKTKYKAKGEDGTTPTIEIRNGEWYINGEPTGVQATGDNGEGDTISVVNNGDGSYTITIHHADGSDDDVITISNGQDGAPGDPGAQGDPGDPGAQGDPGADGTSYVLIPCDGGADCPEESGELDGWFNLYEVVAPETEDGTYTTKLAQGHYYQYAVIGGDDEDNNEDEGEDEETTPGLTVVWDGNYLYIYNLYTPQYDEEGNILKDEEGNTLYQIAQNPYKIFLGQELYSVAFVPDYVDSETGYPTTAPIISISTYLDEDIVYETSEDDDDSTDAEEVVEGAFMPQTGTLVNTDIDLVYRLNPSNAYVEGSTYEFINRSVTVRSGYDFDGDDETPLLTIIDNEDGSQAYHDGETLSFKVKLNGSVSEAPKADLVALRVQNGTNTNSVVTSDYIVIKGSEDVTPVLVDPDNATDEDGELVAGYYPRTKGINDNQKENSDFIHSFIDGATDTEPEAAENADDDPDNGTTTDPDDTDNGTTTDPDDTDNGTTEETEKTIEDYVCYTFAYTGSFNITKHIDLYVNVDGVATKLTDLIDPDLITYTYSYPDEFYVDGVNQQTYAHLLTTHDDGIYIDVSGDSPVSVGHYPVVRVNAYVNEKLVASTYILFKITGVELSPVTINLTESWINYRAITGHYVKGGSNNSIETHYSYTLAQFIALFTGDDYNTKLGIETIDDVWTYYVDSDYDYEVYAVDTGDPAVYIGKGENETHSAIVSHEDVANNSVEEYRWYQAYGAPFHIYYDGVTDEAHTIFYFGVNDQIKTQHTYTSSYVLNYDSENVEHEYAPFLFTLTFKSRDTQVAPNITLSWPFYVSDYCDELSLAPMYKVPDPTKYGLDSDAEAVLVKGKLVSGAFKNETDVAEHFAGSGNIFETGTEENNVSGVVFSWATGETGVYPDADTDITEGSSTVYLTDAIDDEYVAKLMNYNEILNNTEKCPWSYYIIFQNPFVTATDGEDTLADTADENLADANKGVTVEDVDGNTILTYEETTTTDDEGNVTVTGYAWTLSDYAKTYYGLTDVDTDVTVTYLAGGDWDFLQNNLSGSAYLTLYVDEIPTDEDGEDLVGYAVDETDTYPAGTLVWNNGGTKLQYSYVIEITLTIKFDSIGSVSATSEITLNKGYDPQPALAGGVSLANVVL